MPEKRIAGMAAKRKRALLVTAKLLISQSSSTTSDRLSLIDSVRSGLSYKAVEEAARALEMTVKDLAEFGVIAARTLSHSKKSKRFTSAQSDRVTRFFRVWQKAQESFGDHGKARKWMERPTRPLGRRAPVELLDTEEGARLVEDVLFRIDRGLPA